MPETPNPTDFGALSILGGSVHVGTSNAAAPASATAALGNGWQEVGRYNADGFTVARSRTTNQIKDQWGETALEVVTESGLTFKIKFLETSKLTRELHGFTDVASDGSQVVVPGAPAKRLPFCFTAVMADADGKIFIKRHYVPVGQVTETEEIPYKNGEAVQYGITVRAYPAESIKDQATGLTGSAKIMVAPKTT